ncbi:hypothetical protein SAMN05519104_8015 [Rhizobiales bacterium GAS188]|nr:hypothetical protein SAMN05519104_8015 [Rhizobiales bacterium GAS188]
MSDDEQAPIGSRLSNVDRHGVPARIGAGVTRVAS